jgi:hypothetical protein
MLRDGMAVRVVNQDAGGGGGMSVNRRRGESDGYRTLPSLAIRRPVGTAMLTSVVLVLGLFFASGPAAGPAARSIVYPQIRAGVVNRGVEPRCWRRRWPSRWRRRWPPPRT